MKVPLSLHQTFRDKALTIGLEWKIGPPLRIYGRSKSAEILLVRAIIYRLSMKARRIR